MDRPLAALTGATGFLGPWLVRALGDAGYRVRALASRHPETGWGPVEPELVAGRLHEPEALERLVDGAEVVVHAAGRIKAQSRVDFFDANAEGTARVARAAAGRAPLARLVVVSSLSAREPHLSTYAASKAAGEAAARELIPADRLTVVRPPAVYGPGDRETLLLFRAAQRLPGLPLPGGSDARIALIHAHDAAAQIAALAARPASGALYALSDDRPEGYRWREIMQAAAASVGRQAWLVRLPAAAVMALGAVTALGGGLTGRSPILSPGKARELLHPDWSVHEAERAAGLPPVRYNLQDGLADTVGWYREQGWL